MAYRTFGDLKQQVLRETDTEVEEFIQDPEVRGYFNTAVTLVESSLLRIDPAANYRIREALIDVVQGQSLYTLPADIIDEKIRKLVYVDGVTIYEILPLISDKQYEFKQFANLYANTDVYRYRLVLDGNSYKIELVPTPIKSVTSGLRVTYAKDLNRFDVDTTECDLPQSCYEFLMSYVRYRIYMKENHVNTPGEKADMEAYKKSMDDHLAMQTLDLNSTEAVKDMTHYEEHS